MNNEDRCKFGYYGPADGICYLSNGFRWNEHKVCINAKSEILFDNRDLRVELNVGELEGKWYNDYDIVVKVGSYAGMCGPVSYSGDYMGNEKDCRDDGIRRIIERLKKFNEDYDRVGKLSKYISKLENSIVQLSLF